MTKSEKIRHWADEWSFTPANLAILATLVCGIGTAVWQGGRAIEKLDQLVAWRAETDQRLRDLEADHTTRRKVADR